MTTGGWRANLGRFRVDGSSDPSIPASARLFSCQVAPSVIRLHAYTPKCRRHSSLHHHYQPLRRESVPLIRLPLTSPAPACGLARPCTLRLTCAISTNSPVKYIGAVSGVHHSRAPRYCLVGGRTRCLLYGSNHHTQLYCCHLLTSRHTHVRSCGFAVL